MDIGTSYFDAIALAQPTVSPVPTSVLGNITFNITNLLPITIEVSCPDMYACSMPASACISNAMQLWLANHSQQG